MRRSINGLFLPVVFACLLAGAAFTPAVRADTVPGGDVSGTWSLAGSPYLVAGEITVPLDHTLTIEPGVEVRLQGHHKIIVRGRLLAVGTPADTIRFRAEDPATGWSGLRFLDTATNAQPSSELSYCRIEHGRVYGSCPDNSGGAIYLGYAAATVANCLITGNASVSGTGTWGGGGIYIDYSSDVTIRDCTIAGNSTGHDGGGIYVYWCTPDITGNVITGNSAWRGAGIACFQYGSADIRDNDISGNQGEGIYVSGSFAWIVNNRIRDNSANGIRCYVCNPYIIGNLIAGNHGARGAGVLNEGASPQMTNNTIVANAATTEGGGVGSVQVYVGMLYPSNPYLTNTIVRDNTAPAGPQVAAGAGCTSSFRYSNVQDLAVGGVTGGVSLGPGNMDEPAQFTGAGEHPCSLCADSPCRDAGMAGTPNLPATDLAGHARIQNAVVDIGAYEYDPLTGVPAGPPTAVAARLHAHPNPFNPATSIAFTLRAPRRVRLAVHDLAGRRVATLWEGPASAGVTTVTWRGRDDRGRPVPSGAYVCRLSGDGVQASGRIVLAR